jgi:hypothetical protein
MDCEAWWLLLEQMKQAAAEQPATSDRYLGLPWLVVSRRTHERALRGCSTDSRTRTEGVLMDGQDRPTGRLSVGTREQLSTLYRLALAECLTNVGVLDDQLMQIDDMRMDWFQGAPGRKGALVPNHRLHLSAPAD